MYDKLHKIVYEPLKARLLPAFYTLYLVAGVSDMIDGTVARKTGTAGAFGSKLDTAADFMLVATMNPCPCGHLGDPTHECKCTEMQIQNYQKKL